MDKLHIRLQEEQKVFFTSDPHYGHKNVIRFTERPFKDVKEMNEMLIYKWNIVVGDDDFVFCLGDFCWFDSNREIQKVLNNLRGKIYMIPGNHDSAKGFRAFPPHVTLMSDIVHLWVYPFMEHKPIEFVLSHYPLMTWSGRERGVINIHGHVHKVRDGEPKGCDADLQYHENQYDSGVDNNCYYPVEMTDVYKEINFK
jgi:calcineurin-like phosphoesterase family protein